MGIKLKIHFTFVLLALYYGLTGQLFTFLIYTISAILHEVGHSLTASKLGYKLNKVVVMPFGAVVSGDTKYMSCKEEVKIALAGPLFSLLIGLTVVACWWFYPQTYAYTDLIADANFALATVNLIPIMPLDGGRVFLSLSSIKFGREKGRKITKIVGYVLSTCLLALVVMSSVVTFNLSLIIFSAFAFIGQFFATQDTNYVSLWTGWKERKLSSGAVFKRFAVDKSVTVKKALKLLDVDCVNEVAVFSDGERVKLLSESQLIDLASDGGYLKTLGEKLGV